MVKYPLRQCLYEEGNISMKKKTVCVVFGGESSEHDVSCMSADTVINNINRDIYDVIMIGITGDGRWILTEDVSKVKDGSFENGGTRAFILPDNGIQGVLLKDDTGYRIVHIDVVFPVLHGLYGEDGTIQGLLELAGIPYVGCGVLASAASMDKLTTKKVVNALSIRQADYVAVFGEDFADMDAICSKVESGLSYPVFVKPANAGSSVGVMKASDRTELITALENAHLHDGRILVEEAIFGREIECAVLETEDGIVASGIGEILAAADFYDYDAKYNNSESLTIIDPEMDDAVKEGIRKAAVSIFKELACKGLARVDFFVENDTDSIVFNEINTMPGFTGISMYPMLWEARGMDKMNMVTKLIESAGCRKKSLIQK